MQLCEKKLLKDEERTLVLTILRIDAELITIHVSTRQYENMESSYIYHHSSEGSLALD